MEGIHNWDAANKAFHCNLSVVVMRSESQPHRRVACAAIVKPQRPQRQATLVNRL